METLPKITSCFGIILEKNQTPPRIYLVHNTADSLGPNGEEGKPNGWGLPGGGSLNDEMPDKTVHREVLGEAGLDTDIAARGKNSEFGEILFETKPFANNDIYIFFLKKVGHDGFRNIEETSETRRVMLADLGSILLMPLAIKTVYHRQEDGSLKSIEVVGRNSEGIYFSTRERIFGVFQYLHFDFYELIPDLDKLIKEIKTEEVGKYIYNLLSETVKEKNEIRERRANFLRPEDDELLERYEPLSRIIKGDELLERYRAWTAS